MLNFCLIFDVLLVSIITSCITLVLVQTIKENFYIKTSRACVLISLVTSFFIGILFSLTFSSLDLLLSLWSGLFSFVITNSLYKILENKLFKSLNVINCNDTEK